MIRTKVWVCGLIVLLLISCALAVWGFGGHGNATVAQVMLSGEVVEIIHLDQVKKPYTFEVKGKHHSNVIEVEPGRIRIKSADCPDQICVKQGWLTAGPEPIVCLPNKLIISIVENDEIKIDDVCR